MAITAFFISREGIIIADGGVATQKLYERLETSIVSGEVAHIVVNASDKSAPIVSGALTTQSAMEFSEAILTSDFNKEVKIAFSSALGYLAGIGASPAGPTAALAADVTVSEAFNNIYDNASTWSKEKDWSSLFDLLDDIALSYSKSKNVFSNNFINFGYNLGTSINNFEQAISRFFTGTTTGDSSNGGNATSSSDSVTGAFGDDISGNNNNYSGPKLTLKTPNNNPTAIDATVSNSNGGIDYVPGSIDTDYTIGLNDPDDITPDFIAKNSHGEYILVRINKDGQLVSTPITQISDGVLLLQDGTILSKDPSTGYIIKSELPKDKLSGKTQFTDPVTGRKVIIWNDGRVDIYDPDNGWGVDTMLSSNDPIFGGQGGAASELANQGSQNASARIRRDPLVLGMVTALN